MDLRALISIPEKPSSTSVNRDGVKSKRRVPARKKDGHTVFRY